MSAWSAEVQHGRRESLPNELAVSLAEHKTANPQWVFVAEAGVLLNEPEEKLVAVVSDGASVAEAIARFGEACSWILGYLEVELDHVFKWNYLKLSFLNAVVPDSGGSSFGRMTTNAPELPEPASQAPELLVRQLIKAAALIFSHLHASAEVGGWEAEVFGCDWASIVLIRAA